MRTGIVCDDIGRVQVHGGDRCDMAELDRFTEGKGHCLARVKVLPSGQMRVKKRWWVSPAGAAGSLASPKARSRKWRWPFHRAAAPRFAGSGRNFARASRER